MTDANFNTLIDESFPAYAKAAGVNAAIEALYSPIMSSTPSNYTSEFARTAAVIADSSFLCHVRYVTNAYAGKTYNLQYNVTPGIHGLDVLPTFYNLNLDLSTLNETATYPYPLIPIFSPFAQAYQSYLVSHARSGNPNTYAKVSNVPSAIHWPQPDTSGDELRGVMNAGNTGFSVISDSETRGTICEFWREVAAAVTDLGGYAPLGSVVNKTLVGVSGDPSANYTARAGG